MSKPILSVVIPSYNEADSLPDLLHRTATRLLRKRPDVELIIVDNGSTDGSQQILQSFADEAGVKTVKLATNAGYGGGILAGLEHSRGEYVGWTHADLQCDPGDVLTALSFLEKHPDPDRVFVKGERIGRPIADRATSWAMAAFETTLFGYQFREINAQPTIFSRRFLEHWQDPPRDFSLDLYAYVSARRAGLKVVHVPVHFPRRVHGQSRWNRGLADRWRFARRTIDYSLALRRGAPIDAARQEPPE